MRIHTLNRFLFALALAAALVAGGTFASPAQSEDWKQYEATEEELRTKYGTAENRISLDEARSLMLSLVNSDRAKYQGLPSLEPDPLAAQVAQRHAEEMAENRYLGHYNLRGMKAPQRYNEANGTDMVIENVSYWEAEYDAYITPQVVADIEARWLKSPGHFAAIMTPEATHLGFGIAISKYGEITVITAVQLFVVDLSDFAPLPGRIRRGDTVNIVGRLHKGLKFFYAAVGSEPLPVQRTADYLNQHLAPYDTPEPFAGYLDQLSEGRRKLNGLKTYFTFVEGENGSVSGQVTLDDGSGKPKLYYIYLFAKREDGQVILVMQQTCEAV
ncbi:MAG: CAP domain-containing protein [bacterium]